MTVISSRSQARCPFILPGPMNYECWLNKKPEGDNRATFCHLHLQNVYSPSWISKSYHYHWLLRVLGNARRGLLWGLEHELLIANHDNKSKGCRQFSLLNYVSSQAQQTLTVVTGTYRSKNQNEKAVFSIHLSCRNSSQLSGKNRCSERFYSAPVAKETTFISSQRLITWTFVPNWYHKGWN